MALGGILLAGTLWFSLAVLPAVRDKADKASDNTRKGAEALLSAADNCERSIEGLITLTNSLIEVGGKLGDASEKLSAVGAFFKEQGPKFRDFTGLMTKFVPTLGFDIGGMVEWCLTSGTNLCYVGENVGAVATAVSAQGEALSAYGNNGHANTLLAMRTTADTLSHTSTLLKNGKIVSACGSFLVAIGFCVSLLFLINGTIIHLFRNNGHPPAT